MTITSAPCVRASHRPSRPGDEAPFSSGVESAGPPLLKPVDVTVHAHEFTAVELAFDSGIR
jgi:hypothetical protein